MIIKFKIQLFGIRYFYTMYVFVNIEEIKNTLREFHAENGCKIKNTQADFKKVVSYIKKSVVIRQGSAHMNDAKKRQ